MDIRLPSALPPLITQPIKIPGFAHLHVHTTYSIRDGAIKIKDLAAKCRENGMTACAITDHGNLYGILKFYKEMTKQGIKPIIGYEAYVADIDPALFANNLRDINRHLVLLAINNDGYRDLLYIASEASLVGGQKAGTRFAKAIADLDYIEQNGLGKNLICLTACINGQVPALILRGDKIGAIEYLQRLQRVFHEVYIELQINDIPEQKYVNQELMDIACLTGTKLVFTKDAHYLNAEHWEAHDALLAFQVNKQIDDFNRWRFTGRDYYITTPAETYEIIMREGLPLECISNTIEIADKCNVNLIGDKDSYYYGSLFPEFTDLPEGYTQQSYLYKLANDGLMDFIMNNRFKHRVNIKAYIDRLNYELEVITEKGYAGYFLILWDLLKFCSDNDIGYSARGSGVGSLVCKCLNITKQDPIQYGLLFERFLNRDRPSIPDVDLDISDTERDKVIGYMQQKYGANRVAQIITFGQLTIKAAAKEVARLSETKFGGRKQAESIQSLLSSVIPAKMPDQSTPTYKLLHDISLHPERYQEKYGIELAHYIKLSEDFNQVFDQFPDIAKLASQLEGLFSHTGNHAAGVILYPGDSRNYTPLDRASGAAVLPVEGFDMKDIEELGLLKIDILGLSTIRVLYNSAKSVGTDIDNISREDPVVFQMLRDGYTTDVFQLSGGGMTKACVDSRVNSIEDIANLVALYRPGPLEALNEDTGKTIYQQYIDCCQTNTHFNLHPRLNHIVANSKGNMIFQEQVMRIVMEMTGCSLGVSDNIRRLIGKKLIDQMRLYSNVFKYGEREEIINPDGSKTYNRYGEYKLRPDGMPVMLGAMYNGFAEHEADNMWNQMVKFSGYAFNQSHAVAYADTAYQTAFMKLYFPAFYLAEVMTAHKKQEDLVASIKEAKRLGVPVLPPDINLSQQDFTVEWVRDINRPGNLAAAIRFGFGKIMGVSNADFIINTRASVDELGMPIGPFKDIADFFDRVPCQKWNKNKTEALIKAGCFDNLWWDASDHSKGKCTNRLEVLNYYYGPEVRDFKRITEHEWLKADTKGRQNSYVEWNPRDYELTNIKYDFEYAMLGMYISGHPLERLEGHMPHIPWNSVGHRQNTVAYGIITRFSIQTDKNKRPYARFTIETITDMRECIMWSSEYEQFVQGGRRKLPEGTIVEVTGKKDVSRSNDGQFIINKITVHAGASSVYASIKKKKPAAKRYNSDYIPVFNDNTVFSEEVLDDGEFE